MARNFLEILAEKNLKLESIINELIEAGEKLVACLDDHQANGPQKEFMAALTKAKKFLIENKK